MDRAVGDAQRRSSKGEWSLPRVYEVPVRRGRHAHPGRGACVMEFASALAGGRWSDQPESIDATVARLAREVNDLSSERGRGALLPLLPWLVIRPRAGETATRVAVTTVVVQAALGRATGRAADRLARDAAELAGGVPVRRWWQWPPRHGTQPMVRRGLRVLRRADGRDQVLRQVLIDAVNAARALDGLPPVPGEALEPGPVGTLPIRVQAHVPSGFEPCHYHVAAPADRWPAWLMEAWARRRAEMREPARGLAKTPYAPVRTRTLLAFIRPAANSANVSGAASRSTSTSTSAARRPDSAASHSAVPRNSPAV